MSRISILSFIAALALFLCGERCVEGVDVSSSALPSQTEIGVDDACDSHLQSILPGRTSLRSSNSCRRTIQRTNNKRLDSAQIAILGVARSESTAEQFVYTIDTNLLGGVVADKAFYSLCSLRI